jgi:hypothetical protein
MQVDPHTVSVRTRTDPHPEAAHPGLRPEPQPSGLAPPSGHTAPARTAAYHTARPLNRRRRAPRHAVEAAAAFGACDDDAAEPGSLLDAAQPGTPQPEAARPDLHSRELAHTAQLTPRNPQGSHPQSATGDRRARDRCVQCRTTRSCTQPRGLRRTTRGR